MDKEEVDAVQPNSPYWHRAGLTPFMACLDCSELELCGGLSVEHAGLNCTSFCKQCRDPAKCDIPCIRNLSRLNARIHEIRGFGFDNVPRAPVSPMADLPPYVPMLFNRNGRPEPLKTPAVAVRLKDLFSNRTGEPKFRSREEVAQRFGFCESAQLVIVGVSKDRPLEAYWDLARRNGFPQCLALLKPAVVTAPNFSLFSNVPRWDNLHSMKRIAICWQEMAAVGLPSSLHINARTETDYDRWTGFVLKREEIQSVTFEFGTGASIPQRSPWHVEQLSRLGERTGRRLQLILKGGRAQALELTRHYRAVVFVDTTPFMKSIMRKALSYKQGRPVWDAVLTLKGQPIDELLQQNVAAGGKS